MSTEPSGKVMPNHRVQMWLSRGVVLGALVLLICLRLAGDPGVAVESHGDVTVYASASSIEWSFYAFPILTGMLAIVYGLQPGTHRFFGAVLLVLTVWLVYTATTMDLSNHHVAVTPTRVTCEVGTRTQPIRYEIDLSTTAYLYVDHVQDDDYDLVANAATDGTETRIPVKDLMRAALPQILDVAAKRAIIIGESENGMVIPDALRNEKDR